MERPEPAWRFGAFTVLLGASLILHQLWWGGFETRPAHFAVVVAALWAMAKPRSVGRFLFMLGAEVVSVALDMPGVMSHTLLVLVVGASVLGHAGAATLRTRRLPEPGALFADVAPFLRASLLLLYVTAAVAKLNTGFFDPAISCAASMSAAVAWFDPSLLDGAWRIVPAIYGTVLVELGLALLLALPRTRVAGLVLGGTFHAVLALAGNVPFSALALAFYVAFLPAGLRLRPPAWRPPRAVPSAAAILAVGGWLAAARLPPATVRPAIESGTRVLVALALLAAAAGVLIAARRAVAAPATGRSPRRLGPVLVVGLLVLVANSLSPYVGFKTESSFAMFSNLQTEPGVWNHLFIPEGVRVLGYQDRLVRVVGSSDRGLAHRGRGGRRLVGYELERYLRLRPGTRVRVAGGALLTGAAATPATAVLDRVAKFRDVRPPERPGC